MIFLQKMLWYFRNALVRANYTNLQKNIHETTEYLELFLRNLLLDEKNVLRNRTMHISGYFSEKVDIETEKVDIETEKVDIETEKVDIETEKVDIETEKVDIGSLKLVNGQFIILKFCLMNMGIIEYLVEVM